MYRYRRRRYKRGRKRRVLAFLLLVFAFVFAELRLPAMKAELTDALRKSLNGTAKAFVPLGNLTGLMLLNGRGVKIPVRFSVESAVSVRFESVLTGAGINRTAYRTVLLSLIHI